MMPEWLEFLLADKSALQVTFWLIAVIALVAAIVKVWPALSQFVTIVNATAGLPKFIAETTATLEKHTKQLANSHDTNLRDDVTQAIEESKSTRVLVEEQVLPRLEALASADDDLWSALDDTQNPNDGGNDD